MSEEDTINIGDKVNIFFGCADAIFNAEVLYRPVATGDCWRLKTMGIAMTPEIHYVQQFERMDKVRT